MSNRQREVKLGPPGVEASPKSAIKFADLRLAWWEGAARHTRQHQVSLQTGGLVADLVVAECRRGGGRSSCDREASHQIG